MGYNLVVETRSPELRNKMLRFMKRSYKSPGDMAGPPEKRGKKGIVVEYSSCLSGQERVHVYSTVRWMALQVGTLRSKFNKESVNPNVFNQPVTYMSYDSCENWPILVCDSEEDAMAKWPKSLWWCCTDRLGVYLGEKTSESIVHAMSLILFLDKKRIKEFDKEMSKLGPMPRDNPGHEKWVAEKHAVQARLLKPETQAMMKEIRSDMGRLDELWQKFSP